MNIFYWVCRGLDSSSSVLAVTYIQDEQLPKGWQEKSLDTDIFGGELGEGPSLVCSRRRQPSSRIGLKSHER